MIPMDSPMLSLNDVNMSLSIMVFGLEFRIK